MTSHARDRLGGTMAFRVFTAAFLIGVGVVLLIIAWPSLFGLALAPYITQIVALRSAAAAIALIAALVFVIVALLAVPARRFFASLALMLVVFAGINVAVQSIRGFGNETFPQRAPGELAVLAWNTLGNAPGATRIAELALQEEADIIVLPETTLAVAEEAAVVLREAGRPMWVYTTAFDEVAAARSTSVLVSAAIGQYRVDAEVGNTRVLPSIVLRPLDHDGPTIIGVHPVAPTPRQLDNWRADLAWVDSVCRGDKVVLAGDLNATPDHFTALGDPNGLGTCDSANIVTGNGAVGTWPTRLPPLLGAPIDHIMTTDDIIVTGFRVLTSEDDRGSDHRPIVARIILD